jgi:pimeloyl-ACP methyl ester carboxylesterase
MKTHEEEIAFADAQDGPALVGAVFRPLQPSAHHTGLVFIHGNTGKFCDYPYVVIARLLAEHGYTTVNGNTRGHDISATVWKMPEDVPMAGGSAWEIYEDSPHDLAAWIDYAENLGLRKLVLVGHSQGAAKAVYYQAQRQDPRLQGLVLASPDLHGHWPPGLVVQAQGLVEAGKGDELLPSLMGTYWYRLSARNIVSRANVLSHTYTSDKGKPFISDVRCPILAIFGTAGDVGGEPELQTLRQNAVNTARMDTRLIEGADHVYTNQEGTFVDALVEWVQSL